MAYVVDPPHLGVDGAEAESVANGTQPRPRLQGGGGGGGREGNTTWVIQGMRICKKKQNSNLNI